MFGETRRAAWMEVDLSAIRHNYLEIKKMVPHSRIISTVKSDAYGHGAVKSSWELVKAGTDYLGVATLDEAVDIRSAGISAPIVLYSPVPRKNIKDAIDNRIIPVVTTALDAKLLSETNLNIGGGRPVDIMLALDTGLSRLGFRYTDEDLDSIAELSRLPGIRIAALFSHFATADEMDNDYALKQLEAFEKFDNRLTAEGVHFGGKTIANSAGLALLPQSRLDFVRPGLIQFGLYPSQAVKDTGLNLKRAMSVKANIVYLRKMSAGTYISYGRKFRTERESLIATLTLGYADGLPRAATGKLRVIVGGRYAPIVGSVCMDQCMVDVTDVPGVQEYDEVIVMGEHEGLSVTAEEIAGHSGTIPYETLCRFSQRLPRIYRE
ncbi:MAG: alanine racemase [Clostridiales Family XIII bacterium]|jgi:alanine racemase|nr:alanine racemase [Clostridiales Family XIII bacterium]